MSRGGRSSSTLGLTVPRGAGGALTSVDARIRVIPAAYRPIFGPAPAPVMPYDSDGWADFVGATMLHTQIQLLREDAAFGTDLCPPPRPAPMPSDPPPPVFLVRLTGDGESGAFSTEAFIQHCPTSSM